MRVDDGWLRVGWRDETLERVQYHDQGRYFDDDADAVHDLHLSPPMVQLAYRPFKVTGVSCLLSDAC